MNLDRIYKRILLNDITKLANQGDSINQYILATFYYHGDRGIEKDIKRDINRALYWIKRYTYYCPNYYKEYHINEISIYVLFP